MSKASAKLDYSRGNRKQGGSGPAGNQRQIELLSWKQKKGGVGTGWESEPNCITLVE